MFVEKETKKKRREMKTNSRDSRQSGWANLPEELLAEICKLLTRTDSVRIRSVCQIWRRHSVPNILGDPPLRFPLQLPSPITDYAYPSGRRLPRRAVRFRSVQRQSSDDLIPNIPGNPLHPFRLLPPQFPYHINDNHDDPFGQRPPSTNLTLQQNTTYVLQPNPSLISDSDSSDSNCWLVTAQERYSEPTEIKVRLLNPISKQKLEGFSGKSLDCRDYRVTEVFRTYTQEETEGKAKKVVIRSEDCLVLAISDCGILAYHRFGDKNWTPINGDFCYYIDITIYRGKFYVVDQWGLLSMIDDSMKPVKVAAPVYESFWKCLVVSLGELYLIDMATKFPSNVVVEIRVYKLNEEEHDWDRVNSIGDRVLFVGVECAFFLSAHNLRGLKGRCIYFIRKSKRNEDDSPKDVEDVHSIGVFNFEDGSIAELASFPVYSSIFWPPPAWLRLD